MKALHALMVVSMSLLCPQCALKVTNRVPSLSISIMEDSTTCRDSKSHFHVVVTNVSNEQLRVGGYSRQSDRALAFIFTDQAGKKWVASKICPNAYTIDIFSYRELHPREKQVFKIYNCDSSAWEGFPRPKNEPVTVTMQAFLNYQPDKDFLKRGVWAGQVVSKPKKFTFYP